MTAAPFSAWVFSSPALRILMFIPDPDSELRSNNNSETRIRIRNLNSDHNAPLKTGVAAPDLGSGVRCFFFTLDTGSGIVYPDLRSQTHIFESLVRIFGVKRTIVLSYWLEMLSLPVQK